jgi:hypothetical protein
MDLRKIYRRKISRNPKNNGIDNLELSDEHHKLSDESGAPESLYVEEKPSLHCGCFADAGGRCGECGAITCIKCHQHCGGTNDPVPLGCQAPLCREHSHYVQLMDGRTIPFCKHCYGKIVRKKLWKATGRALLLPFIDIEDHRDG